MSAKSHSTPSRVQPETELAQKTEEGLQLLPQSVPDVSVDAGIGITQEHSNASDKPNRPMKPDLLGQDPGVGVPFIDVVEADHMIQTSVITPFDKSGYAQTLHNPVKEYHQELITVQNVNSNIREHKPEWNSLPLTTPYRIKCYEQHELHQTETDSTFNCDLCRNSTQKIRYRCDECKYDACPTCVKEIFVRRQLDFKTVKARYFTRHVAKPVADGEKSKSLQMVTHAEIEDDTSKPEGLHADDMVNHAIIGFWRPVATGAYECYRSFRIDNPAYHHRENADGDLAILMFVGANNELFYFNKSVGDESNASGQFTCNVVDVQAACKGNASLYSTGVYQMPTKKSVQLTDNVNVFLGKYFASYLATKNQSKAVPQLYGDCLVFHSNYVEAIKRSKQ